MEEAARRTALEELHAFPGHVLWRTAARAVVEIDAALPEGVDLHAYATLLALAESEPQSQRSLADTIGVSGTTLTSVANGLQRDGLVERVRNSEDRRSYALTRTPAGRSVVRRGRADVERLEQRLTGGMTPEDVRRLHELLLRVIGEELDARTPAALRGSTAFLVIRAHQRTHREFLTALRPLAIEPRHYGTMRALSVAGPITQNEVATLLEVSPATVVQIVDHLEQRGLVVRERDLTDRRAHRLLLTDEGVRSVEEAQALSLELLERLGGPESRDRKDLARLLRLLPTLSTAG